MKIKKYLNGKIMDYEQKYNKLVNAIKVLQETNQSDEGIQNWVNDNVPELRESEDERIRQDVLDFIKREGQHIDKYKWHKWIAWLEKHKPVEHLELKAGHWYICHRAYCCRADDLTIKEGERFMCEKDGVVKGFMIKDPEKYFIEVHAPAPMEDDQNDEVRRRSTIQVLEYARSLDAYNQYGKADIDKNIAWLEKQGEQKYIDDLTQQEAMDIAVAKCFEQGEQKPIEEINGEDYGIDGLWHAQRILEKTLGEVDGYQTDDGILEDEHWQGVRERAAIAAMQGIMNFFGSLDYNRETIAKLAVEQADALIEKLKGELPK